MARAQDVLDSVAGEFRRLSEASETSAASARAQALRERRSVTDTFVLAARETLAPDLADRPRPARSRSRRLTTRTARNACGRARYPPRREEL